MSELKAQSGRASLPGVCRADVPGSSLGLQDSFSLYHYLLCYCMSSLSHTGHWSMERAELVALAKILFEDI